MVRKRVKVETTFPRKLFFERLLSTWKEKVNDKNRGTVLYRALTSLKNCPVDVEGVDGLLNLRGIGEHIATRLHNAWTLFSDSSPASLEHVKQLDAPALLSFLDEPQRRPQKRNFGKRLPCTVAHLEAKGKQKLILNGEHVSLPSTIHGEARPIKKARLAEEGDEDDEPPSLITCLPDEYAQVILIADMRENNVKMKGKTTWAHLEKSGLRVEQRPLSVGDYLWVARKMDGSEMVLDYVVERKTWDDLRNSITGGRYEEQKQRLRRANFPYKIYLIEGESSNEQALITTQTHDSFLIHRSTNTRHSVQFLIALTRRLETRLRDAPLSGFSFDALQELVKKSRAETVREAWTRLLCVCPGMSSTRASLLTTHFPSLAALDDLLSSSADPAQTLFQAVPQLGKSLCTKLVQFFVAQ